MPKPRCSEGLNCGNDGWGNVWHESRDCPLNPLNVPDPPPDPPPNWLQQIVGPAFLQTSRGGWIVLFVAIGLPLLLVFGQRILANIGAR